MLRKLAAVGLASVALSTFAAPAAVAAGTPIIEVQRTSNNVFVEGDSAFVTGKYRCSSDVVATHVWVSVKQGGDGDLTGHGSSAIARSMYDTNVSFEGVEPELTCNGTWQQLRVELGRLADKEALERGTGWLQFCMYAQTADGEMAGASENRWAQVKTNGRTA